METNKIIQGDCIEEIKKLEENSIDAIVTDPPYGIGFMGKNWDSFKPENIKTIEKEKKDTSWGHIVGANSPALIAGSYDFSYKGKVGYQKFSYEFAKECIRVLKPGGFMLVSCSTRMYHRLVCGIEDAGFEIRDTIMWLYGSGFPKSLNIGKQIDKVQGNEGTITNQKTYPDIRGNNYNNSQGKTRLSGGDYSAVNKEWEGWGTALKPACEPIVVARKPLSEKNVALNVLKWGTGGINIDACRIGTDDKITNHSRGSESAISKGIYGDSSKQETHQTSGQEQGRFPANIILDEEAGKMLDEQSGETISKWGTTKNRINKQTGFLGGLANEKESFNHINDYIGDKGGASRFFYCAKASKSERNFGLDDKQPTRYEDKKSGRYEFRQDGSLDGGIPIAKNNHPTVKPIKLMEYLVKLVSKEGATILDPFLGSGTTGIASIKLNRKFIGIEKEEEYIKISKARIKPHLEQRKL